MKTKKQSKINYYFFGNILSIASVGLLHGYDLITIKLLYFFDSFRIYFKLDTWDGTGIDELGTLTSWTKNLQYHESEHNYRNLKQTDNEDFIEAMITFGYIFGAIFGAYVISLFTEKMGRKKLVLISTVIYSIGSFITACSFPITNIPFIITIGRFITGISIGALSVVCPLYISEIAPANSRDIYIYIYHTFTIIGGFFSGIINVISYINSNINPPNLDVLRPKIDEPINNSDWRRLFLIEGLIGLVYLLIVVKTSESPRWLCYNERYIKAKNILSKLHENKLNNAESIEIYENIKNDAVINRSKGSKFSELWISGTRRYTLTIYFLYFFQQWTGYAIYNYLMNRELLQNHFILEPSSLILIFSLVFLIMVFIIMLIFLVKKIGKKVFLVLGTIVLLIVNSESVINGIVGTNNNINKSLISGPIFDDRYKCTNNVINNEPFYIEGGENPIKFYNNTCHNINFYCNIAKYWISWDGENPSENYMEAATKSCMNLSQNISDYTKKGKYNIGIFIFFFLCVWAPIPLIYQTELFTINIRDKGGSIGIISKYINQGLVTFIGPRLMSYNGKYSMLPYTVCTSLAFVFVTFFCPAIKNIELEDIEAKLSNMTGLLHNRPLENIIVVNQKAKYQLQEDE
ncbi:MFS general substrate transporter [Anaeromyces robustus]|uniref:MFS general substrate transporter n=1 Tax=Anaeromyces robustus TaxID=1754192 RepID=A0A1Y1WIP0_9FUNG|nr:MFS general substrate transporter [Anaeromyces robustus]|eukprot:ORX73440.1 MFS general substrate transporter [Anaeromyces robustus]